MKPLTSLVIVVIGIAVSSDVGAITLKSSHLQGLPSAAWKKPPGFTSRISQSGLDFIKEEGLRSLRSHIQTISVSNQQGSSRTFIGTVDFQFTSIHVTSFSISSSSLTPNQAAAGLALRADGISLGVSGHWHYRKHGFIPISDSGTADATASSVSLTITIRVGRDTSGHPTVSSRDSDCSFNIGSMRVRFHGGASWLYNLFDDKIADSLKRSLTSKVCAQVVDLVNNDLKETVQNIQTNQLAFDGLVDIDYSLVEDPDFAGSVNFALKGEMYPRKAKTECPLPVPELPADMDTSRMVFFWITEFLANSAGYALQNVGYLQYNVTPDKSGDSDDLNTSKFAIKYIIPQIATLYPDMPMQIILASTKAPVTTIKPSGIQAVVVGHASFFAILPNKTLAHLFTLGTTIGLDFSVRLNGSRLLWTASTISADISLVHSDIGFVITPLLQIEADAFIDAHLLPRINAYGAVGTPLPKLEIYKLSNPAITQGQGYLKIGMDISRAA